MPSPRPSESFLSRASRGRSVLTETCSGLRLGLDAEINSQIGFEVSSKLDIAEYTDSYLLTHRVCRDVDQQAQSLRAWTQTYEQLSAGAFQGCTTEIQLDEVQLFREVTHQQIHQTGLPRPDCYVFAVPMAMTGRAVFSGQPVEVEDLMVLQAGDLLDFCAPQFFDVIALTIPADCLCQIATQLGLDLDHRLRGGRVRSARTTAFSALLGQWRTFLQEVFAMGLADASGHSLKQPRLRQALVQSLLTNLLMLVESLDEATEPPLPASRRQLVDRARAYLQAHAQEPVTIADLCAALGVSRRTLQYSFQEVLDINPVRYLKALRLNGARRDLQSLDASQTTVSDVATQWGFWHLSRFATEYRQMFGELPSQTLQACRYVIAC